MASTSSTAATGNPALDYLYSSNATSNGSQAKSAADMKDQFLKLLVAQMQNQDPLNPLDNAQVTSQMAQISTVEGIENLNSTMGRFTESAVGNAANSTGLIGKTVLTEGSSLTWEGDIKSMPAGVSLEGDASKVVVQLLDAGGVVVDTRTFTNQPAGTLALEWTGTNNSGQKYGAGRYTMRVAAADGQGQSMSASTLTPTTVRAVTQGNGAVMAQLANGRSIDVNAIKGVF